MQKGRVQINLLYSPSLSKTLVTILHYGTALSTLYRFMPIGVIYRLGTFVYLLICLPFSMIVHVPMNEFACTRSRNVVYGMCFMNPEVAKQ